MDESLENTAARLDRIREAGTRISETAAHAKLITDELRADVNALLERVVVAEERANVAERESGVVADNLVVATEKVEQQQVTQDDRLDNLEN